VRNADPSQDFLRDRLSFQRWGERILAFAALALGTPGCAVESGFDCASGQEPAVADTIYFGTRTPHRPVSAANWLDFLAGTVTPRFPAGLTHWEANGQWGASSGIIDREVSHVLQIAHRDTPSANHAIREIVDIYKRRYRQSAVLRVRARVCISF
jgi:hypothetical protein